MRGANREGSGKWWRSKYGSVGRSFVEAGERMRITESRIYGAAVVQFACSFSLMQGLGRMGWAVDGFVGPRVGRRGAADLEIRAIAMFKADVAAATFL